MQEEGEIFTYGREGKHKKRLSDRLTGQGDGEPKFKKMNL